MNVRRPRGPRKTPKTLQHHSEQVVAALKADPSKLELIKNNLEYYRQQRHLKRGFLLAIERFDWVFSAHRDVDEICDALLRDDYIGKRLRRYPLLYKGVLDD
ncbi:hypothetical protein MHM89_05035 [Pseudoalteromonas sp. CNC9-20]|uniref:hypothetical protein n=1 Tax=Pseudoalteromonas sp. CNC9-20 TaxID=2917750 RepID=UPI001EF4893B|nr:hypothetical protein [Pseudoalteromonas sp. CNC9-20]MCG7569288.1 hypothetical protein [Pseudoalteromonas sp. CNC9-20]